MIGAEWFRLPNLPEGTPEEQLRAVRNYLYQLSEQLQYAFSHTEEVPTMEKEDLGAAVLGSAELVERLAAMAGKRLEGKYIGADSWEADRRRGEAQWARVLCALAALEDRPGEERRETDPAFRRGEVPGYQEQTGERVCFTPFAGPETPFRKTPEGHWRTE